MGRITRVHRDMLRREYLVVENLDPLDPVVYEWYGPASIGDVPPMRWVITGGLDIAAPDRNRATSFVHNGLGQVVRQAAYLVELVENNDDPPVLEPVVRMQETAYIHDAARLLASDLASNDLLAEIHYPDTTRINIGTIDKPQPTLLDYNRQGEVVAMRDPNTTLHEYSRDLLGRVTLDKATVSTSIAAFEIDFRVNALATTYDAMGRVERVRSYTDHGGGSEAVVNEVAFNRDPLWRVVSVAQQHDGAVTGGSLAVGTSYETEPIASGNLARQATLVYPGGWTLATGYGSSGSLDDRISRPAALVDPAISSPDPQAYAAYSYIGLATPALVDLPIPGFRLTRFHADNGETTPGAYPGLDRYGRVVRQMWVDDGFTENSGSSTVPNVPPIVSTAYTYDTASNRTGAFDARPKSQQPLSNMYAYDGLHRLVNARRGVWTGGLASPSVSQLKGSQEWALDPLGNWSSVGTDLDGAGGIDADETEPRDHRDPSLTPPTNRVNELFQRELSVDSGGGIVDLAYDYAGNLLRQQLQSGGALRYTHDAWNRLVKVEFEDAEEDLHPRAEYEYNPLNWRTVERTDTNTTDSTHALDEMRVMLYDASWRLLESRIDSDYDPESEAPDFEEFTQHVWGLRYIDDIVATRRDLDPAEDNGHEVKMFHATDAQCSSVAVLLDNGALLERVAYSAYGVARHQWPADASGDGAVNSVDLTIVLNAFGGITSASYKSEADFNRDGTVNSADLSQVLGFAAALPEGTLSSAGVSNRVGYCGYQFAPETGMYLARNRWNSPPLGRWIERDPLGYVDGMGLYEYVRSRPIAAADPWGLSTATGDRWWAEPPVDDPGPYELGWEWLTNPKNSPSTRAFGPQHSFTRRLQEHSHLAEVRQKLRDYLQDSCNPCLPESALPRGRIRAGDIWGSNWDGLDFDQETGRYKPRGPGLDYDLGGWQGVPKYVRDYSTVFTGGATGNLAVTFLGSYKVEVNVLAVDCETGTTHVRFVITNNSTLTSATRPPVLGYRPWWQQNIAPILQALVQNSEMPMATKSQRITWTEELKVGPSIDDECECRP